MSIDIHYTKIYLFTFNSSVFAVHQFNAIKVKTELLLDPV